VRSDGFSKIIATDLPCKDCASSVFERRSRESASSDENSSRWSCVIDKKSLCPAEVGAE